MHEHFSVSTVKLDDISLFPSQTSPPTKQWVGSAPLDAGSVARASVTKWPIPPYFKRRGGYKSVWMLWRQWTIKGRGHPGRFPPSTFGFGYQEMYDLNSMHSWDHFRMAVKCQTTIRCKTFSTVFFIVLLKQYQPISRIIGFTILWKSWWWEASYLQFFLSWKIKVC